MSAGGCRHEVSAFLSGDGGRNPAGRKIESERAATKTCRRSFGFFDGDVAGVSDSVLSGRFSPGRSRLHDSVLGLLSAACLVPDRGREWHESVGTTRGSMLPSHRAVIADSRRPHSRSGTEPPTGGVHREDGRLVRRRFLIRSARRIGKGSLAVLRPVRLSFSGVPCCRPRRRLPSSIRCRLRARRCSGRSRPADRFPRKPRRFFRPSLFRGAPGRD